MVERLAVNERVPGSSPGVGAIQNKKQNCRRVRRQASENPRGFSKSFATKPEARDPARSGY